MYTIKSLQLKKMVWTSSIAPNEIKQINPIYHLKVNPTVFTINVHINKTKSENLFLILSIKHFDSYGFTFVRLKSILFLSRHGSFFFISILFWMTKSWTDTYICIWIHFTQHTYMARVIHHNTYLHTTQNANVYVYMRENIYNHHMILTLTNPNNTFIIHFWKTITNLFKTVL